MLDVSKIRNQLEVRLQSLNQRIEDIEGDLRTAPSADFEEQATETEGDQVLEGVEGSARMEAQQIHAALKRIEAGTYGECMTCGDPISEQRLQALPYAVQCIGCARG
jgi:RNA polymerase-binding transcription factor